MAAEWYYTTNKQQMGPVSWEELVDLARNGLIKASDKVWTDGMADWVKAVNQKGLFNEDAEDAETSAPSKSKFIGESKPPPGRKSRRREDEEADEEEDNKAKKKGDRRSEEEGVMTSMGVKIGLIVGGVLLLLVVGVACIGGMIYLAFFAGKASRTETYEIKNLGVNSNQVKAYEFKKGQKVITSR